MKDINIVLSNEPCPLCILCFEILATGKDYIIYKYTQKMGVQPNFFYKVHEIGNIWRPQD